MSEYQIINDLYILRLADGANIPNDPLNSDWIAYQAWIAEGNQPLPTPEPPFDDTAVLTECQKRIYTYASDNAQKNMMANALVGNLSETDMLAFKAGLVWISDMQTACRSLIAAKDRDFADDAKWPTCPQSVINLAARF